MYQGDNRKVENNEMLGEVVLGNLREAERGEVSVDITFGIDQEGLVNVAAIDSETGRQRSVAVRANTGLNNEEKEELVSPICSRRG